MAVNINTVYQTVLYILNKEQRGYVTPAEFNSLAAQVQDEIFQSYFPDGNQVNRFNQNNSQNDTEFFNIFKNISYKLTPFIEEVAFTKPLVDSEVFIYLNNDANGLVNRTIYNIGDIISTYTGNSKTTSVTQLVSKSDYNKITRSKLTAPTNKNPIVFIKPSSSSPVTTNGPVLKINPLPDSVLVNALFKPTTPYWRFNTSTNNSYIYSSIDSVDFELETSEQSDIIMRILMYCGVIINDPTVIQAAAQDIQQTTINEKS
jgi:hypothetical protein